MKDAATILDEFGRLGTRVAFDLKTGVHYEGYIIEVEDGQMLFGEGGPFAPEEPYLLPADAVDLGTLSYLDEARHTYMDAYWDEARGCWMARPAREPGEWEVVPTPPSLEDD
jgi:hypothetical protein